jgi:hypothetical protein
MRQGESRQPLLDYNLENVGFYRLRVLQPLRLKRWDYCGLTTPTHYFSFTLADLGYAGQVFAYWVSTWALALATPAPPSRTRSSSTVASTSWVRSASTTARPISCSPGVGSARTGGCGDGRGRANSALPEEDWSAHLADPAVAVLCLCAGGLISGLFAAIMEAGSGGDEPLEEAERLAARDGPYRRLGPGG